MASKKSIKERFESKVERLPGIDCWLWIGSFQNMGYGTIEISKRPLKRLLAHRASWQIHFGEIPEGMWVLHKCDVPCCVNPEHLFLGTMRDNIQDMMNKGRCRAGTNPPRGENCVTHKLTELQVREIKHLLSTGGISQQKIADTYHVAQTLISHIKLGKAWAHIKHDIRHGNKIANG